MVIREIQIRAAGKADVPGLADLYVQNHDFQRRGVAHRLKATSESWKREGLPQAIAALLDRRDTAIFVAEANGGVIGLVDVFERSEIEVEGRPARRYAEVQNLVVAARWRRQHIGTQLMDAAEGWAHSRAIEEIELHIWEFPEGPLGFYERRGYRTLERTLVVSLQASQGEPQE